MSSKYGDVIMRLRARAGLTQRQVAEAMGLTVQTVSNWENGVRIPKLSPKETMSLCRVLNCSLEELADELPGEKESG
ncbi:helix-turn-helix transcriptional regulator [Calothrix sp. FACHB-1219]|uniref:helix-turn-helix transcriptional regulator n=1 Tax=Nostocales TaxID=1161 RepID=UPI0016851E01|nr:MULTISPECIES: helix-turn-helix transcriptional regulator [Nostocales]MBD2207601.1 helix-turn-helix transcriptional regulator [Calothrix sp. FACHB-168]MBD2222202.1 helix-turn-helix transcriptional regulator [Calothrix sp. FACHB-1219]MBD2358161.1 helix-turn-helix transcriptional regulator [Tolypothrix sp. FACHB-123]